MIPSVLLVDYGEVISRPQPPEAIAVMAELVGLDPEAGARGSVRANPALATFDDMSFSSELGLAKPEPAAFRAVLETLGVPAGEVLFIDDRPENVASAIEAGLQGVRFRSADRLAHLLSGP